MSNYLLTAARRNEHGAITRVMWYRDAAPATSVEADVSEVIEALSRADRVRVEIGFMRSGRVSAAPDGRTIVDFAGDASALGVADLPSSF